MRSSFTPVFVLAVLIVVGTFVYLIVRGTEDTAAVALISTAFGTVISWSFASHIANGAADNALAARIASTASRDVIVSADKQPGVD